jgi:methyl-accepting chemotaxis protein
MFKLFEKISIGKKVIMGFLICFSIIAISILTTTYYVKQTEQITNRLINLRIPTAQNTASLLNGVNHSLAALRGWIILGKDIFKIQRQEAWKNLNNSIGKMDRYSQNWTNPENVKIAKSLKENLPTFERYQKEIENIAHTLDNTPATKILLNDAAPKASIMLASITNLINLEMKMPGTKERKKILGIMADVRGSTARALANIRAFLLSGDKVFQDRFNTIWSKNIIRVKDLKSKRVFLSEKQKIQFDKYYNARSKFKTLPQKMFDIRNGDSWNLANKWLSTKAAPIAFKIKKSLELMSKNQNILMTSDAEASSKLVKSLTEIEYILLALSFILIFGIGYVILKSIKKEISVVTEQMAEGMEQITLLATKIDLSSQSLSSSSEQQSSSMQETSSTMNEIEAMVSRNKDEAKSSSEIASKSYSEVNSGTEKIKKMVGAISDIRESNDKVESQINSSNDKMIEITTIIKTIGEKTQVINDIVFQTKLLSFNASVEAARAGEHGKGFAVVAEEVGNLAKMSGEASIEIYEMLEGSIASVEKVAKEQRQDMDVLISESKSKISEGINLGEESEAILKSISSSIGTLKTSINQIAVASEEQSNGVAEISKAIIEVNDATRMNSNISHETAQVSNELNKNIKNLNSVLGKLSS